MTVAEFLAWASAQPRGRYELVRGQVVAMAPERARHALVKGEVFLALRNAVRRAGLPCAVFPDGMMVAIDDDHAREPDASVQGGAAVDLDAMILDAPLIVVEVRRSPASSTI
jgi:Uma2 family endonuclease